MQVASICFVLGLLSMATVGAVVPMVAQFARAFGATPASIGAALALFSMPSALSSFLVGQLCDRLGGRNLLLSGGLLGVVADALLYCASSTTIFCAALLLGGIGFTGIIVSAPVLIISASQERWRPRALSLWSTYAPVGIAAGLFISIPFAGHAHWRNEMLVLGGLLIGALALALRTILAMPTVESAAQRASPREMARLFREAPVVRLAIALSVPSALSYGTSLLAPSYITRVHHMDIGAASALVAVAKIVVVLCGGLFSGWLLSRHSGTTKIFALLCATGLLGQLLLFHPDSGLVAALAGLGLWLFAYAGIAAVAMALLPVIFTRPAEMGAASGLINQLVSCISFLAPIVYFASYDWTFYPILCAVGLLFATLILPRPSNRLCSIGAEA